MKWSAKSGGNIAPSRFVKQSTSADNTVTQAGAGETVYGVSPRYTRRTPYSSLDDGYCAISGEDVEVYGVGEECWLELGATATAGQRLKSDADGKGTPVTANNDEVGAVAIQSGTSGQLIRVQVTPGIQYGA